MQYYTKIDTCFKRGENHAIIPEFTNEVFKALKDLKWEAQEKIDGTNISVELKFDTLQAPSMIEIRGKTPSANIPGHLLEKLKEYFNNGRDDVFKQIFMQPTKDENGNVTGYKLPYKVELFGEGYGVKIQKGGNYIRNGVDFILFDIAITPEENGKKYWLRPDAVSNIAGYMDLKIVPFIGTMTIKEACEYANKGFKSIIAENKDYEAEGLVLKAPFGILDRLGNRIITKIKTCDFREYFRKNGKEFPVENI